MNMMKMIKEAAAMRSKISQMDKALKERVIEVENQGVTLKINAKNEFLDVKITPELLQQGKEKLEKNILVALKTATQRAQEIMAEEAKKITGGLNIPGLM
jgi:DNA-binding YbaB/EbfC family protein